MPDSPVNLQTLLLTRGALYQYVYMFQYNPWGKGHGNPPMFDDRGRMVKPVREARGRNDLVRKTQIFFYQIKPKS